SRRGALGRNGGSARSAYPFSRRWRWRELFRRRGPARPPPVVDVEQALAHADRLGRDLDQLVVLDIGDRLFEAHLDRRRQPHRLVLGGRADIGALLALSWVA